MIHCINHFGIRFGLNKVLVLLDRNAINMLFKIIQLIRKFLKEIWK